MKRKIFVMVSALIMLAAIGVVLAKPAKKVNIPQHAVEIAPGVFDLGVASVNGKFLQGYMFIDYKKGYTHRPNHNGGTGGTTCFAFLSQGAKWKTTEPYVLDTTNSNGMTDAFVDSVTAVSLDTWDSQVTFEIFGGRNLNASVDGVDTVAPDNKNEIFFGNIADPGAIAVTTVWGIFSGPPKGRELVEFDAVFDDVDFFWGDAAVNSNVMDYQNIAVHEFGHAAGMGHPGDSCTEETMYRFSQEGETKKRTLNAGDISGVRSLYK